MACTAAVNSALGRGSTRHRGRPCPFRSASDADGRMVLAHCELGCFDEAVDLLADVLTRVCAGRPAPDRLAAYANHAATTALGQLHRERRGRLGLPQRPERIPEARWAIRVLPDRADRLLLAHMLTWLGSDACPTDGAGWPIESWAGRYRVTATAMRAWVSRICAAMLAADPPRYIRYLADPLATKPPRRFALLGDIAARPEPLPFPRRTESAAAGPGEVY
ncbi:hypothetical protein MXD59_23340 [Frankia sp. Ag45/Mut15]|uniref:RNA polymerase, sigma-24 subunit, ECF subfamily n=1 Tax=Frankia umida TaxID=573489 RepID=A0ABT0K4M4_9ACTN|nr:hypothetical protein [Frankia umida]MCK9878661.1 hypothetical protein [Frankia umida]